MKKEERPPRSGLKRLKNGYMKSISALLSPFPTPAPQQGDARSDAESIFNSGAALKEVGFFEEAIQEFQRASELQYRVSECYEEIGDAQIQMGSLTEGIRTFYTALQREDTPPEQQASILEKVASAYEEIDSRKRAILEHSNISFAQKAGLLEKIASVYEGVNEKKKAAEVYRDLNALEKSRFKPVEMPEEIPLEPKRFRLSVETVCEHPRLFLVVSLLLAFIFMSFLPYAKTVNNV